MPFIDRGIRLIGSASFDASTMAQVLDLMARTMDRYPWASLISHTFPLEDAEKAIQEAIAGRVVRAALVME